MSGWSVDFLKTVLGIKKVIVDVNPDIVDFFELCKTWDELSSLDNDGKLKWAENVEIADESLISFFHDINYGTKDLTNYEKYLANGSKSTLFFSSVTKKASSVLKSFAATLSSMVVMWAIGKAINLIVEAIDSLIVTHKEQLELIQEAKKEYEESTSTLVSLEEKLASTKKRIDELNSLDIPSFTEQDELDNLQKQNDELERSIALERERQKLALENTIKEITSTYQNNRDKYNTYKITEKQEDNIQANEAIQFYTNEQINNPYTPPWTLWEPKVRVKKLQQQIKENNQEIENIKKELLNITSKELEDYIKIYESYGIENLSPDQKASYQSMKVDLDDIYKKILDPGAYFEIQLKPIFQSESLDGIEEKILNYFSNGGTIEGIGEDLGNSLMQSLEQACEQNGIDPATLLEHMYGKATDKIDTNAVREQMIGKFGLQNNELKQVIYDLNDEEIEAYVKLNVNPASDNWNLDEWLKYIKDFIASKGEGIKIPFILSDEKSKSIDDFQSKMNTISSALQSLRNGTKIDLTDLYQEFGFLLNTTDDLDVALQKLVDSELKKLYRTLGDNVPSSLKDALDAVAENAVNTSKETKTLSNALSALTTGQELLSSVKETMSSSDFTGFDLSILEKMISTYADMEDSVNSYVSGWISVEDVYAALEKCYQNDIKAFEASNQSKIYTNDQYYSLILKTEKTKVDELSKAYKTDFNNYKNLATAKKAVEEQLLLGISSLWHKYYDIVQGSDGVFYASPKFNTNSYDAQRDPTKQEMIQKANELNQFYRDLADTFHINTISFQPLVLDASSKSNSKSAKSTKDFENLIDWVSQSLEILQSRVTKSQEAFQNTKGYDEQIVKIKELINAQKGLASGYSKAAETYYQQYQKALGKTGMAKKVKSSIESGTKFNIEDFIDKNIDSDSTGTREKLYNSIQDAIDWYNKYSDASKNKVSIGLEISDNELQILEIQLSKLTAKESILTEKLNSSTLPYLDQIGLMGEQLAIKKEILQQELKIAKAKNDTLEAERISIELENTLAQDRYQQFATLYSGIQSEFDHRESLLETQRKQIEARMEYTNTVGLKAGQSYYERLIELQKKSLTVLKEEKEELKQAFDEAVAYGRLEIGTDAWYEQLTVLTDLDEKISDAQQSIANYQVAVRNLTWENFDLLIDKFSRITKESDFLIDLLSQSKLINEDGSYTSEGTATQAQRSVNYTTYMEIAKEYERAANELINATDQESIAKREEYLDAQQNAIQSALQEKQAMIDLVKEGIQAQINAFEKLIQKKKESLDTEKALYDYQKTIADKNKEIASIQRQIDIFSEDDSLENQKRLRELYSKLQNAEDDLYDTEHNHSIESQKSALDKELESYKDSMNVYMENTEKLFLSTLEMVKAENTSVATTIRTVAKEVGYTITNEMGSAWANATSGINQYATSVTSQASGILSVLESIRFAWENVATAAEKAAIENIGSVEDQFHETTTTNPSKITVEDILGDKTNNTISRGESAINQYVTSLGYQKLGNEQILNLAKLLGIDGLNEKNLWNDDSLKLRTQLLNQLKSYLAKNSFSTRGIVKVHGEPTIPTLTGEDNISLVKNNETILTKEFIGLLPKTVEEIKNFISPNLWNQMPTNLWSAYPEMNASRNNSVNTSVGEYKVEVNVYNPANPEEILYAIQKSSKLQRGIQAVTIDQMLGKSKYTVNQIR